MLLPQQSQVVRAQGNLAEGLHREPTYLKKNELIGLVGEQIRVDWLNDNTEINLQVQHTHIF